MNTPFQFRPAPTCSYVLIAETGKLFSDFAPYVATVDHLGRVAFQAALSSGGTGVFVGDGGEITTIAHPGTDPPEQICSHPAISADGRVSFYAEHLTTGQGVFLANNEQLITLAHTHGRLTSIGPLGPTMNDAGAVAFRATSRDGAAGVYVGRSSGPHGPPELDLVAEADAQIRAFQGLPVINGRGDVAFRCDLAGDKQGIFLRSDGVVRTVATTGATTGATTDATTDDRAGDEDPFIDLGRFPIVNDARAVAFSGVRRASGPGVFVAQDGRIHTALLATDRFGSVRGALIDNTGALIFYATPLGGELGIYAGVDPLMGRILGIGDALFDSIVTGFALNPVSINDAGQLAVRVVLRNERQLIIRMDIHR